MGSILDRRPFQPGAPESRVISRTDLVRRFGCRVVGLDISSEMIRKARSLLATGHMECFERLSFFEGHLEAMIKQLQHASETELESSEVFCMLADAVDIRARGPCMVRTRVQMPR